MTSSTFRPDAVRVRVPATSANLGPGFDALGLALALHDEVEARVVPAGVSVTVKGEGAGTLPLDEQHLVVRAMYACFDLLGGRPPGLEVVCHNRIPQARGLGSSSAAIVAGLLAARALVVDGDRMLDAAALLRLAASLEGHPDNVAPCLLGGFTIAWTGPGGAHAVRLEPAEHIRPVVFIPQQQSLTEQARGLLPERVPHVDAALNAGRAALLTHALTRQPDLLLAATEDRLHQEYRAPAFPHSAALLRHLRAAGVPAVISGAGPTVLAFGAPDQDLRGFATTGFAVCTLSVDSSGAVVLPT